MKRTQRLSIEIQHREVTISVSSSTLERQDEVAQEADSAVAICEICGSPWIPVVVHGSEGAVSNANTIHRALEQVGMHVHLSATGELSICRKSLEDPKEKH